jgi:hypothetical protein
MGRTGFGWLRIGSDFCEHGNKPSGPIIFFEKLSDNRLFK